MTGLEHGPVEVRLFKAGSEFGHFIIDNIDIPEVPFFVEERDDHPINNMSAVGCQPGGMCSPGFF